MVRVVLVAFAILCVVATKVSAGQMEDVVYLENGGIVRGTILEQIPDKSLKIKRRDGKEFKYRTRDIVRITREPILDSRTFIQKKNPMVALGLSFPIVGSGQFYNGEYTKGVVQMGAAIVGLGLILGAGGDNVDSPEGNLDADNDDWRSIPGYVLFVGGAIWSLIDAPMSANRINRQNRLVSHGHLIELDGDVITVGIDPVTSDKGLGTAFTIRF